MQSTFKVVLLGDERAGKSTVFRAATRQAPSANYEPTIGVDFGQCAVQACLARDAIETDCLLRIWDTSGNARFASLVPAYTEGAALALVFYDATSVEARRRIGRWIDVAAQRAVITAVVATHCDCVERRAVFDSEELVRAEFTNVAAFYEVNARNQRSVDVLLVRLSTLLIDRYPTGLGALGMRGSAMHDSVSAAAVPRIRASQHITPMAPLAEAVPLVLAPVLAPKYGRGASDAGAGACALLTGCFPCL